MIEKPSGLVKAVGFSAYFLLNSLYAQKADSTYDFVPVPKDSTGQYVLPVTDKGNCGDDQDTTLSKASLDSLIEVNNPPQSVEPEQKTEDRHNRSSLMMAVVSSDEGERLSHIPLDRYIAFKYSPMFSKELGNSSFGLGASFIEGDEKYFLFRANYNKIPDGHYADLSLGGGIMWTDFFCTDLNLSFFGTTGKQKFEGGVIPNLSTFVPIFGNNYSKLGAEATIGYMFEGRDMKREGIVTKAGASIMFDVRR